MKQFTQLADVADPAHLLKEAIHLKANPLAYADFAKGKTIVLLFFKPSLRTRLSTEKAAKQLGFNVMSMNAAQGWKLEFEDQIIMNSDRAEHVREAAAVISQYADVIGIRTFPSLNDRENDYQDSVLKKFIQYAQVPIISLESAIRHPLQSLTDWMTIVEQQTKPRPKVVLSWAPHPKALPQAVANSFLEWMKHAEVDLVLTHPPGYELANAFTKGISIEYEQEKAFEGADFVYAKNWSAYSDYGQRPAVEKDWMITKSKMKHTNQAKFMHCLPVRRNVVVEDAVLDSPQSLVIEQANNRTYAAQAVLKKLFY